MGIPSEDHFMKEVAEAKQMSMHWADIAKKVEDEIVASLSSLTLRDA